jgi:glycosyltransferase involved in cell wall biosynthesis
VSKLKNILFYGPVGYKNGNRIGGGESGNKRTIEILQKIGFNVIILRKPYPIEGLFLKPLIYPIQLLYTYIKFIWLLATKKVQTFHLSAFYFHLIYIEYAFILTCKILGIKSIYEVRAGGAEAAYENRSSFYRLFFRATIKQSKVVLCQGTKSMDFIKNITGRDALYYPNYIMDSFYIPHSANNRDISKKIKLVYFGRIVPTKNIEFVLEICKCLHDLHIDFDIEIIGNTNGNNAYMEKLQGLITQYGLTDVVATPGAIHTKKLYPLLLNKHFFVFPTIEDREGHSNSLTEAMSRGVVPILSDVGFNRSIVRNDYLIIKPFDPELYAAKIIEIWNKGSWIELSKNCHHIIETSFTESAVTETLYNAHTDEII